MIYTNHSEQPVVLCDGNYVPADAHAHDASMPAPVEPNAVNVVGINLAARSGHLETESIEFSSNSAHKKFFRRLLKTKHMIINSNRTQFVSVRAYFLSAACVTWKLSWI